MDQMIKWGFTEKDVYVDKETPEWMKIKFAKKFDKFTNSIVVSIQSNETKIRHN